MVPNDFIDGRELTPNDFLNEFTKRMSTVWDQAVKHIKHARDVQTKYYNELHKMVGFNVGDLVLLNNINLNLKNEKGEFKRNSLGCSVLKNESVYKIIG